MELNDISANFVGLSHHTIKNRDRPIEYVKATNRCVIFAILRLENPHNAHRKSVQGKTVRAFIAYLNYQSALPEWVSRAVFHQRRLIGKFKCKRRIIKRKERVVQLKKKPHSNTEVSDQVWDDHRVGAGREERSSGDVSDRIIGPEDECIQHLCSDLGENTEKVIFKLKLHIHGKRMVSSTSCSLSSQWSQGFSDGHALRFHADDDIRVKFISSDD